MNDVLKIARFRYDMENGNMILPDGLSWLIQNYKHFVDYRWFRGKVSGTLEIHFLTADVAIAFVLKFGPGLPVV